MLRCTYWPRDISNGLQVLRPLLRHRPHLGCCWVLVCQAISHEQAPLKGLARLAPRHIAEWHLRRLLTATYWHWRVLLWWFADQVIATRPTPEDGVCSLVVDSTRKDKPGQKPPLAKQGRLNAYAPSIFGLHMVVVMLHWGNDRIPVAVEVVRRKADPRYRSENRRFRWRLVRFRRPLWAEMVVVVADAAFASTAHLQLIQRRGYPCVMALARTWCFANGRALKALGTHVPKKHDRRCWVPLDAPGRRRTSWTDTTRVCLRHSGDVTIVLSKPRRHEGPKPTTILVTHLPAGTARQVVDVHRRRWTVELLMTEVKGAVGLGQPQVTKAPQRVERSIAISVMASLMIVKFRAQDIPERGSWSIFTLKRNFMWQLAQAQLERSVAQRLCQEHQQRRAA